MARIPTPLTWKRRNFAGDGHGVQPVNHAARLEDSLIHLPS